MLKTKLKLFIMVFMDTPYAKIYWESASETGLKISLLLPKLLSKSTVLFLERHCCLRVPTKLEKSLLETAPTTFF